MKSLSVAECSFKRRGDDTKRADSWHQVVFTSVEGKGSKQLAQQLVQEELGLPRKKAFGREAAAAAASPKSKRQQQLILGETYLIH